MVQVERESRVKVAIDRALETGSSLCRRRTLACEKVLSTFTIATDSALYSSARLPRVLYALFPAGADCRLSSRVSTCRRPERRPSLPSSVGRRRILDRLAYLGGLQQTFALPCCPNAPPGARPESSRRCRCRRTSTWRTCRRSRTALRGCSNGSTAPIASDRPSRSCRTGQSSTPARNDRARPGPSPKPS